MRYLLTFFLFISPFTMVMGQEEGSSLQAFSKGLNFANIEEEEDRMSLGFKNSFSIHLPTDDRKLAIKVWKTYVSSRFDGRTKYNRKAKEYRTEQVNTPASYEPVNLIGKPEKFGKSVKFTLWMEKEGEYVKSIRNREEARAIERILEDFVVQVEKEKVRLRLLDEEKELRKLEHKLRRLELANARYHREIEMAKERIKKMEGNIVSNEKDQITANSDILRQKDRVASVKKELDNIN